MPTINVSSADDRDDETAKRPITSERIKLLEQNEIRSVRTALYEALCRLENLSDDPRLLEARVAIETARRKLQIFAYVEVSPRE